MRCWGDYIVFGMHQSPTEERRDRNGGRDRQSTYPSIYNNDSISNTIQNILLSFSLFLSLCIYIRLVDWSGPAAVAVVVSKVQCSIRRAEETEGKNYQAQLQFI